MPLGFAELSEQLFKVNSKLAQGVLLYVSSASPVPHLWLLTQFWEANAKLGSSSKNTIAARSPSLPRLQQLRFRFRLHWEVEEAGSSDYF